MITTTQVMLSQGTVNLSSTTGYLPDATYNLTDGPIQSTSNVTQQNWQYTKDEQVFANINNIVYYSVMFPVALLGNIVTLATVIMVLRIKKSIPNLLIGVLASADLTSLLACHVISIASIIKGSWIADDRLCHFQSMMAYTYFKLGFFTKTNISLDRFIALACPLRYRSLVTMRKVTGIIVFNVLFSFATSGLTLIFDPQYIKPLQTWPMCTNEFMYFTDYKLFVVIFEGMLFFIGVILFIVGNGIVISVMLMLNRGKKTVVAVVPKPETVWRTEKSNRPASLSLIDVRIENRKGSIEHTPLQKRVLRKTASLEGRMDSSLLNDEIFGKTTKNGSCVHPDEAVALTRYKRHSSMIASTSERDINGMHNGNSGNYLVDKKMAVTSAAWLRVGAKVTDKVRTEHVIQRCRKKEIQFAKLVMVIVTVFVILWIPYMAVIYYEHSRRESMHPLIEDIAIKLVFANACINPILYGLFNVNFRKAYVYYIHLLCFYITCKGTRRPTVNGLPWTLKKTSVTMD